MRLTKKFPGSVHAARVAANAALYGSVEKAVRRYARGEAAPHVSEE